MRHYDEMRIAAGQIPGQSDFDEEWHLRKIKEYLGYVADDLEEADGYAVDAEGDLKKSDRGWLENDLKDMVKWAKDALQELDTGIEYWKDDRLEDLRDDLDRAIEGKISDPLRYANALISDVDEGEMKRALAEARREFKTLIKEFRKLAKSID